MKYSFRTIVESLPKKKNSKSSLWVKIIIRKLSFLFTYIFVNLGFSAWAASVMSIFVAIGGCIALSINDETWRIIGVILVEFWLVLDCVDGNIARVKKSSSIMGEFIDAQSGYFISGFVYFAVGIAGYFTTYIVAEQHKFLLLIIGAVASISNILTRLIHQKYIYSIMAIERQSEVISIELPEEQVDSNKGFHYLRSRLDKELGLSGLFMPFLIMAQLFKIYDIMSVFYAAFSITALFAMSYIYGMKSNTK